MNKGSKGSILSFGVKHTLPKANVSFYANAQRFESEDAAVRDSTTNLGMDTKDTVFTIGTVVIF